MMGIYIYIWFEFSMKLALTFLPKMSIAGLDLLSGKWVVMLNIYRYNHVYRYIYIYMFAFSRIFIRE